MNDNKPAVLVVEDETLLRLSLVDDLEEAGFRVFEAANADEAIAMLGEHSEIRVMFTDVDMPGSMDGLKLAKAVRDRFPPVKIVVTSGHVQVKPEQMPEGGLFFPKPYRPQQVIATLRQMAGTA